MQFLTIVKTILTLLPLLVQAITAVEAAFPQANQGTNKLALLKEVLMGSSEVAEDIDAGKFDKLWPAIQKTVAAVVGLANATGAFKK